MVKIQENSVKDNLMKKIISFILVFLMVLQVNLNAIANSSLFSKKYELEQIVKPFYEVTIPNYLPVEFEFTEETVDDGEYCEEFDEEYFETNKSKAFPFFIDPDKPAILLTDKSVYQDLFGVNVIEIRGLSEKARALAKKIRTEGFVAQPEADARLRMHILSNRMVSLEKAENRLIIGYFSGEEGDRALGVEEEFMFWMPNWRQKKINKGGEVSKTQTERADIARVIAYYQALKKFNKEKAFEFIQQENATPDIQKNKKATKKKGAKKQIFLKKIPPPYKSFREYLRFNVKATSASTKEKPVYFVTFDSDIKSLKVAGGLGLFDYYDRLIYYKSNPDLLSTGYSIKFVDSPRSEDSVELDMLVRHAITSKFGLGAYYPEPNMFVLISYGETQIAESFHENAEDKSQSLEGLSLLMNLKKRINFKAIFFPFAPLETTPTEDMLGDDYSDTGFNEQDKKNFRETRQSHVFPLERAHEFLEVLGLKNQIEFEKEGLPKRPKEKITISDKKKIADSGVNLLTRVFGKFDPFSILDKKGESLLVLLKKYDEYLEVGIPSSNSRSVNELIEYTKNLTDFLLFKIEFDKHFDGDRLADVLEAAKRVGSIMRYFLATRYFPSLKVPIPFYFLEAKIEHMLMLHCYGINLKSFQDLKTAA